MTLELEQPLILKGAGPKMNKNVLQHLIVKKKIKKAIDFMENLQNVIYEPTFRHKQLNGFSKVLAEEFKIETNTIANDVDKYVTMEINEKGIQYTIHKNLINKLYDIHKNRK